MMKISGIKKCECDNCSHKEVCAFKSPYEEYITDIEKVLSGKSTTYLCFEVSLNCIHFSSNTVNFRPNIKGV